MGRAYSPYYPRVAVNLGRWPRLIWRAPLALDCEAAQDGFGACATNTFSRSLAISAPGQSSRGREHSRTLARLPYAVAMRCFVRVDVLLFL